jgi:AraC-like DNA-binding protein
MSGFTGARQAAARSGIPQSKGMLGPVPPPLSLARHYPSDELSALVRHYWIPRWNLPPGKTVTQQILEYPGGNLVIEPDRAALYGVTRTRGEQSLQGTGWAFGVLLEPGASRALLGRSAAELVGTAVPLPELPVAGTASLTDAVRAASGAGDDTESIRLVEDWFFSLELPADPQAALVREVVRIVEDDRDVVRVDQLAERSDLGTRRLQRLVSEYLGVTPKWLIQRFRLQEAAHALTADGAPPSIAALAAELGYADQAHFSRDFARLIGVPPGEYQRTSLRTSPRISAGGADRP